MTGETTSAPALGSTADRFAAPSQAAVAAAASAQTIVQATQLSKWYGQVSGLNDVTASIPGGITGLLGPNGAGKSTFMKLMTGQLKPSKGVNHVFGEPMWGNPGIYRAHRVLSRAGRVLRPDDRARVGHRARAAERPHRQRSGDAAKARARARSICSTRRARRSAPTARACGSASSWRRRWSHDPDLLILDEPLTGMDPLMRRKTIRFIKEWARAGKHIIVSSHILHEIESMTSNILLINNGRIVAEGNVHAIRDLIDTHPHTVFIRGADPRALARRFLAEDDVLSLRFEPGAVVVETARPDAFYARLTDAGRQRARPAASTKSPRPTTTCRRSSATW